MKRFEFDFHPRFRRPLKLLGVTPDNSYVTVSGHTFFAKFGRWELETPLANITCHQRTGDYKWFKAIGIRGSWVDHGLTFGSTNREGVCVKFADPIPPFIKGMRHHPGLTVTVADPAGLVAALEANRATSI